MNIDEKPIVPHRQWHKYVASSYEEIDCATKEEFLAWAKKARWDRPQNVPEILDTFCSDCTLVYREKMQNTGLCRRPRGGWGSDLNTGPFLASK